MGIGQKMAVSFFLCTALTALGQVEVTEANHGSAQLDANHGHFHGGSDLAFKIKLDNPLPPGARFDVRLSPVGVNQEISVSSAEPANKDRTEFLLHAKLPEGALAGEWHIALIWLFLPGTSWTSSQISTNDLRFFVEGPKIDLPTRGTATLVSPHSL
jgi:hypothetical protein